MDLQQIKYFLAVVDCGTFLAASRRVHVSQPTLSAGIKKLEESLGVKLFHRGSRLASLTPAGEQFLGPARQSFNQLFSVKSKLSERPEKIVIGVLSNIHMDHVAKIVSSHRATHPHVLIELVVAQDDELAKMLQTQKVDLILVNSDTQAEGFTSLIVETLCVVTSEQHPLAKEKRIELDALSGELFIERVNCSFWNDVQQIFLRKGIVPNTVMQSDNDESILALVSANLGVSIITDRTTPYDVSFIPLKEPLIDRSVGACICVDSCAPHVKNFYDSLIAQYRVSG